MPIFKKKVTTLTLKDYLMKMKIGLPKTMIQLDKNVYEAGSIINGTIVITGGMIKNKIKRYDIDLISVDQNAFVEETLNSHSVFCSLECCPNQTGKIDFLLNVPEDLEFNSDYYQYSLSINIDLGNTNYITQTVPIKIASAS